MTPKPARALVLSIMSLALLGVMALPAGAAACTITGTSGDDTDATLGSPTSANEVYCLLAGNDLVHAGSGNDRIKTNDGNDEAHGGVGRDIILGHRGADKLVGNVGKDDLLGGPDDDNLISNDQSGIDFVDGGTGFDVCLVDELDTVVNCEAVTVT